jgi:hypothetical protein
MKIKNLKLKPTDGDVTPVSKNSCLLYEKMGVGIKNQWCFFFIIKKSTKYFFSF